MARSVPRLLLLSVIPLILPHAARAEDQPGAKPTTAGEEAKSIVTDPLEDTNIKKRQIPPTLAAISDAPYSLSGIRTCKQIVAAVNDLDSVLGPDVDAPAVAPDKTKNAVSVAKDVIGSFIPGRGLVREISGANKAEREYDDAVYAGIARRAYLKGVGTQKGCKPPAAPLSPS